MTAICIQPADFLGVPYKPWRFRDDDKALAKRAAQEAKEAASAVCSSVSQSAIWTECF